MSITERFWAKVARDDSVDGCWPWTAGHDRDGYGTFHMGSRIDGSRRKRQATHVAWFLETGEWPPEGLQVLHRCDNPPCCA